MLSFVSRTRHIHPLESLCFFIKITIYYGYISHVHDGLSDAPGKLSTWFVGVSNDAVNFLGVLHWGLTSARYNIVMGVAAAGVLLGCTFSSGMMEIARSGIFNPQLFTYWDVMLIFFAVMLTDVLLLDTFNSLGLPTSTTVSIVFELLGASVVSAAYKLWVSTGTIIGLGAYINNEKALSIIIGILASVVIAFTFGTIIQWLMRYLFTFRYSEGFIVTSAVFISGLCLPRFSTS